MNVQNEILRSIGALGFALTLGATIDAGAVSSGLMAGFLYLLFSTINT